MRKKYSYFRSLRYLIYLIVIILSLVFISSRLNIFPLYDFIQYWSAAQINLSQGNPYSPDEMLQTQVELGWDEDFPIMMWNPPVTLGLMLPFGLLPYNLSRLLWFISSLLILAVFIEQSWRIFGGNPRHRWLAWVLVLAFGPVLQALKLGQIVPLMMLGLVGFMVFMQKERFFLAGLAASLMLVKPHTLYLFWIALLLWSLPQRTWRLWAGVAAGIALPMILAWGTNPQIINQYLNAFQSNPPDEWITATLGSQLRLIFGDEKLWLQFVPSLIGGLLFVVYFFRQRSIWDWAAQIPLVVLASVASAAYGWVFDLPLCAVAVVAVAARMVGRKLTIVQILLIGLFVAASGVLGFANLPQNNFWWGGSLLFVLYWLFQRTVLSQVGLSNSFS